MGYDGGCVGLCVLGVYIYTSLYVYIYMCICVCLLRTHVNTLTTFNNPTTYPHITHHTSLCTHINTLLHYLYTPIYAYLYSYHQHDSQELMQFVLDGLHEDLNRVGIRCIRCIGCDCDYGGL